MEYCSHWSIHRGSIRTPTPSPYLAPNFFIFMKFYWPNLVWSHTPPHTRTRQVVLRTPFNRSCVYHWFFISRLFFISAVLKRHLYFMAIFGSNLLAFLLILWYVNKSKNSSTARTAEFTITCDLNFSHKTGHTLCSFLLPHLSIRGIVVCKWEVAVQTKTWLTPVEKFLAMEMVAAISQLIKL